MVGQIYRVVGPDHGTSTNRPLQLPLSYCTLEKGAVVLVLEDLGSDFFSVLGPQTQTIISRDYLEPCLISLKNCLWEA